MYFYSVSVQYIPKRQPFAISRHQWLHHFIVNNGKPSTRLQSRPCTLHTGTLESFISIVLSYVPWIAFLLSCIPCISLSPSSLLLRGEFSRRHETALLLRHLLLWATQGQSFESQAIQTLPFFLVFFPPSFSLSYFFPPSDGKSLVHSGEGELNPLPAHSNPGSGLSLQTQWGLENWTWDNCVAIPFLL